MRLLEQAAVAQDPPAPVLVLSPPQLLLTRLPTVVTRARLVLVLVLVPATATLAAVWTPTGTRTRCTNAQAHC